MNDVCTLTHSMTPNQIKAASWPTTGSRIFCATGASIGTMMKAISKKSRKKARKKTNRLTTTRKPQTPPGRFDIMCSTHRLPSTPWKVIEKQVAPTRMNATIAVMRIVAWKAWMISSRSSLNCQARQHSQTIAANITVKAAWKASDLKATSPIRKPTPAAMQPAPNIPLSNLVSGALRTTASTIAPMVPMAPASVGVARPIMMVPSTRKISTMAGMMPQAHIEGVGGEQGDLQQRGAPGAEIHVADRAAELVGQHDQHQRRRHQLGDGAGGRQHAGGVAHVVLVAQHHGQGDHGHGDDLRRHSAGDGAQDEADDDGRVAETAPDGAEQLAHRFQHVLGQPAFLQDRTHEGEERDGEQQLVRQDVAEHAARDGLHEGHREVAHLDRHEAEEEADGSQRKGDRVADDHEDDEAAEHQRRHPLERDHDCCGLS